MTEVIKPIPARLKNMAVGGHVAGAKDIIDDVQGKTQDVINKELLDAYHAIAGTSVIPVASGDWPVENPVANVIYRVGGINSYTDYMYDESDLTHPVELTTFTNVGNLEEVKEDLEDLAQEVSELEYSAYNVKKTINNGFYVTDSNGYVAVKYDENGLDANLVSQHLIGLITEAINNE